MIKWQEHPEYSEFLKENVRGIPVKELAERFNERFGLSASFSSIERQKHNLGLKSGTVGYRFSRGHTPFNKGKKWDEYLSKEKQARLLETCFKKGNVSPSHREVLEERTRKGYVEIKVAEPNVWMSKQKYIYEQVYGKVPEGQVVIFLDGNDRNFDIENLQAISREEHAIMNRQGLRSKNAEATKTGVLVAKIIRKRGELNGRK